MQVLKCKKCGAKLEVEEGLEIITCEACGSKFKITKTEKPQKQVVPKKAKKEVVKGNDKREKKISKPLLALISVVILAVLVVSSLFVIDAFAPANPKCYHKFVSSTFNGSYDNEGSPNSYYQVETQKDKATGERLYSFLDIKVSATNKRNISEIWINISDLYEDELTITMSRGYALNSWLIEEKTLTAKEIKADEDGWFRIYNDTGDGLNYYTSGFYGELKLGFSADVRVREVVILDVKKEACSFDGLKASIGKKPTSEGVDGFSDLGNVLEEVKKIKDEHSTCPFIKVEEPTE